MPESFGARLRQQRERRQVALATIAKETKIKQSLLEAMERGDVSQWPTGIFRRAFMKAYARAIGLEPDPVVDEFLQLYPDPAADVAPVPSLAAAAGATRGQARPPMRLRYLIGSASGLLTRTRTDAAQASDSSVANPRAQGTPPPPPTAREAPALQPTTAALDGVPPADCARQEKSPSVAERDLLSLAKLSTRLGQARRTDDFSPLLQEAARILDAIGVVVWMWDAKLERLRPAWAHGYPDQVLSRVPAVARDANNATATAFRLAQPRVFAGSSRSPGALVVPLMTAAGCGGVLAIELRDGAERSCRALALATILASQFARMVDHELEGREATTALSDRDRARLELGALTAAVG